MCESKFHSPQAPTLNHYDTKIKQPILPTPFVYPICSFIGIMHFPHNSHGISLLASFQRLFSCICLVVNAYHGYLLWFLLMLIIKTTLIIAFYLYRPKWATLIESRERKLSRHRNIQPWMLCFSMYFLIFCNTVPITSKYIRVQYDSSVWKSFGPLNTGGINISFTCVGSCALLCSTIKGNGNNRITGIRRKMVKQMENNTKSVWLRVRINS